MSTMTSLERLGELAKAHRELKNLTQDDVAARASRADHTVNRSHVAHLEQGLRVPKPDVLASVCELLGIPPQYWKPFQPKSQARAFLLANAGSAAGSPQRGGLATDRNLVSHTQLTVVRAAPRHSLVSRTIPQALRPIRT